MKLKDSISVFLFPFNLPQGYDFDQFSCEGNEIWESSNIGPDISALLPYVASYFANSHMCKSYKLHDNGAPYTTFWDQNKSFEFKTTDENNDDYTFQYKYPIGRKSSSPMLFIMPKANIGILSISTELEWVQAKGETRKGEDITSHDLMLFNYRISRQYFKRWRPCDQKVSSGSMVARECQFKELCALLLSFAGLRESIVKARPHIFTYAQIIEEDTSGSCWPPAETIIRLMRVENLKYKVLATSELFENTFVDIAMGVCVEGGALITRFVGGSTPEPIRNFKTGSLLPRYLWLYIMAVIQRETAISITESLANSDLSQMLSAESHELLYAEYERLNHLKLSAYFPDVSNISQMNAFYSLCVKNFNIKEYVENIDDKMRSIRSILERRQDLYERRQDKEEWKLEKQRDLEESRRYQESKMLREQENAKERRNEKHLNYIILGLTFLTIISVVNDFASYIKLYYEYDICDWVWAPILSAVLGLVFFLVGLICFMRINMKTKGDVETYKNNKDKHK